MPVRYEVRTSGEARMAQLVIFYDEDAIAILILTKSQVEELITYLQAAAEKL